MKADSRIASHAGLGRAHWRWPPALIIWQSSPPPALKIGPSRYGGSPGGERYGQVAGSCKPHLLCLPLLRACTSAKPSYLYKMPASTSPSLTSGPECSASSTRVLIRPQGPQVHSCYWLWRRFDRLSASPPEGKVGKLGKLVEFFFPYVHR